MEKYRHVLLVTFPAQGHINPALQFAKRLVRLGAHVTLATSVSSYRRMTKTPAPQGLSFATYSDGYDDGFKPTTDDLEHYIFAIKRSGSKTLTDLIVSSANEGRPFQYLVYNMLLPWAGNVARELHLPSAVLWIQPATVLDIYYYYFNGYGDDIRKNGTDPSFPLTENGSSLAEDPKDETLAQGREEPVSPSILPQIGLALEVLEEELRALNNLMHLKAKKMGDDLHDMFVQCDSLLKDNKFFHQKIQAQRKEIEVKDWEIRSKNHEIQMKDLEITLKVKEIQLRDLEIKEKDLEIASKAQELQSTKNELDDLPQGFDLLLIENGNAQVEVVRLECELESVQEGLNRQRE
ncbi:hypothetical protein F2P56_015125, partial [Juglans regia]